MSRTASIKIHSTRRSGRCRDSVIVVVVVFMDAWDRKAKGAAVFGCAVQPEGTTLPLDQLSGDRQAQANPALGGVDTLRAACEPCEEVFAQVGLDTLTCISNVHSYTVACMSRPNRDRADAGIAPGVVEQLLEHAAELVGIGQDVRQARRDIDCQR